MFTKKVFFVLFAVLIFFDGCGEEKIFSEIYYKWHFADDYFYFRLPVSARVDETKRKISFEECELFFDEQEVFEGQCAYRAENFDFTFRTSEDCCSYAQKIAESFTDKNIFLSNKYRFKIQLRYDFENEFLPEERGFLMRHKGADGEIIEIRAEASFNVFEFKNLGDFLNRQYHGYSTEFVNFSGISGVYVDKSLSSGRAIRYFFAFSESGDIIYEVKMGFPRDKYTIFSDFLDEVLNKMEIF